MPGLLKSAKLTEISILLLKLIIVTPFFRLTLSMRRSEAKVQTLLNRLLMLHNRNIYIVKR